MHSSSALVQQVMVYDQVMRNQEQKQDNPMTTTTATTAMAMATATTMMQWRLATKVVVSTDQPTRRGRLEMDDLRDLLFLPPVAMLFIVETSA